MWQIFENENSRWSRVGSEREETFSPGSFSQAREWSRTGLRWRDGPFYFCAGGGCSFGMVPSSETLVCFFFWGGEVTTTQQTKEGGRIFPSCHSLWIKDFYKTSFLPRWNPHSMILSQWCSPFFTSGLCPSLHASFFGICPLVFVFGHFVFGGGGEVYNEHENIWVC